MDLHFSDSLMVHSAISIKLTNSIVSGFIIAIFASGGAITIHLKKNLLVNACPEKVGAGS